MHRTPVVAAVVLAMVAVIVAVDIAFLRHHFWTRLIVNVVIVAVIGVIYLRFRHRL